MKRLVGSIILLIAGSLCRAQAMPAPATQPAGAPRPTNGSPFTMISTGPTTRATASRRAAAAFAGSTTNSTGTAETRGFRDQTCYSSSDLIHWHNEGVILSFNVDANRMDVLYNELSKKYVMVLKYNGNGAHLGFALADKPEGPFTFMYQTLVDNAPDGRHVRLSRMMMERPISPTSRGRSAPTASMASICCRAIMSISKSAVAFWDIPSREANHVFKRNGIYYYGTSRTAGIQSSGTSYYTAKDINGPWSPAKPMPTPGSTNSWDSQVDFVYLIKGTQETLYLFDGDRWTKDLPKGATAITSGCRWSLTAMIRSPIITRIGT